MLCTNSGKSLAVKFWRSVVEKCWKKVLWRSVGEECCRDVLQKNDAEKWRRADSYRSVGEECG